MSMRLGSGLAPPALRASAWAAARTDPAASRIVTVRLAARNQTARRRGGASSIGPDHSKTSRFKTGAFKTSPLELVGLLELVPHLLHAGDASGRSPRRAGAARWIGAVEVGLALGIGVFVAHLFLGRSVGYAGENEHRRQQHDHSADLPDSEHGGLPPLSRHCPLPRQRRRGSGSCNFAGGSADGR